MYFFLLSFAAVSVCGLLVYDICTRLVSFIVTANSKFGSDPAYSSVLISLNVCVCPLWDAA